MDGPPLKSAWRLRKGLRSMTASRTSDLDVLTVIFKFTWLIVYKCTVRYRWAGGHTVDQVHIWRNFFEQFTGTAILPSYALFSPTLLYDPCPSKSRVNHLDPHRATGPHHLPAEHLQRDSLQVLVLLFGQRYLVNLLHVNRAHCLVAYSLEAI